MKLCGTTGRDVRGMVGFYEKQNHKDKRGNMMRIRYNNRIRLCTEAIHPIGSFNIILYMYDSAIFEARCSDRQQANELYEHLLTEGWLNLNAKSITVKVVR